MAINPQPTVILVEPQLGENIGMCARAMLNCGLERLRLVRPRDGWPQASAQATAADADIVLENVEVFETLDEAIADCERVFATTARSRSLSVPVVTADVAATTISESIASGDTVGVLFGPEASGLDNEAIARADTLLRFPTNPDFASLNLAQSVLLFGWEWRRAERAFGEVPATETANRESLEQFLDRLEGALDEKGFFLTPDLKPHSLRTLRSIFTKANASEQELQFLHGMITSLLKDTEQG